MKLVNGTKMVANQPGTAKIVPEEPDDVWLAYNLIALGDVITASTTRKVRRDSGSDKAKSAACTVRVRVNLEIRITAVDYFKDSSTVRVQGKSITANSHVAIGSFHTHEIEQNKEFEIRKKLWDSNSIERLQESCERASGADLAVLLFQQGLAKLFLVGPRVTTLCAKIEAPPNKTGSRSGSRSGPNKYFESVFNAFVKHVDLGVIRCVVIGSPDSKKDEFRCFLVGEAQRLKVKNIENNKSRIVVANTRNSSKSLHEVLHEDGVVNMIKDTKAVMEIKVFKEFADLLMTNSDRACYGPKSVEMASELMAIEKLLITSDLFESAEVGTRLKYAELVKSVKKAGGKAFVFSSSHVSGAELAKLTGIAATLRFPVPDVDE